jgi:hypothetical protein
LFRLWTKLGQFGDGGNRSICELWRHSCPIRERWFWAFLLLKHEEALKRIQEAIMENLLILAERAMSDVSPIIAPGLDILHGAAIALLLVFLWLRMTNKKDRGYLELSPAESARPGRFFERQRLPVQKQCPHCAMQLPLAAILCEGCDYNFLAERPGRGQRLLPPPEMLEAGKSVYELTNSQREDFVLS